MASLYEMATEWSLPKLKKEYTKLRDAFQKQIGRLSQVDQSRKIQAFLPGGYKHQRTIKEIENLRGRKNWSEKAKREDWARRVAELQELRSSRSLSISGRKAIRKDRIQSLKKQGLTSINNSNYDKFVSFMTWAKDSGVLDEYGSDQVAEAFDQWISGGLVENEELADYLEEWQSDVESADLFND